MTPGHRAIGCQITSSEIIDLGTQRGNGTGYRGTSYARAWDFSSFPRSRRAVSDRLNWIQQSHYRINAAAFSPDGGWIISFGHGGYSSGGLSPDADRELHDLHRLNAARITQGLSGVRIRSVALGTGRQCVIIYDDEHGNNFWSQDIPAEAARELRALHQRGHTLDSFSFAPSRGWLVVYDGNAFESRGGVPQGLLDELTQLNHARSAINSVAISPSGTWVVAYSKRDGRSECLWSNDIPEDARQAIQDMYGRNIPVRQVALGPHREWVVYGSGLVTDDDEIDDTNSTDSNGLDDNEGQSYGRNNADNYDDNGGPVDDGSRTIQDDGSDR